jgi:hypothetical protein
MASTKRIAHGTALGVAMLTLAMCLGVAQAATITVPWTGSDLFEPSEDITVPFFVANQFLGATGTATYGEMPGLLQRASLQARIDGVVTQIATSVFVNGSTLVPLTLSSQWGASSSFPTGTIEAIRIVAIDSVGNSSGANFDSDPADCIFFSGCLRRQSRPPLRLWPPGRLASVRSDSAGRRPHRSAHVRQAVSDSGCRSDRNLAAPHSGRAARVSNLAALLRLSQPGRPFF